MACFYWKEPVTGWRRTARDAALRNSKDTGVRAAHYVERGIHREYLTRLTHGDCIYFRYLDFGKGKNRFTCSAASHRTGCILELHIDGEDVIVSRTGYTGEDPGTGRHSPARWKMRQGCMGCA